MHDSVASVWEWRQYHKRVAGPHPSKSGLRIQPEGGQTVGRWRTEPCLCRLLQGAELLNFCAKPPFKRFRLPLATGSGSHAFFSSGACAGGATPINLAEDSETLGLSSAVTTHGTWDMLQQVSTNMDAEQDTRCAHLDSASPTPGTQELDILT